MAIKHGSIACVAATSHGDPFCEIRFVLVLGHMDESRLGAGGVWPREVHTW